MTPKHAWEETRATPLNEEANPPHLPSSPPSGTGTVAISAVGDDGRKALAEAD